MNIQTSDTVNYYQGTTTGDNIQGTYIVPQPAHTCPNCGYCPACGRGRSLQPYPQPIWYWNPNTAPFYVTYTSTSC